MITRPFSVIRTCQEDDTANLSLLNVLEYDDNLNIQVCLPNLLLVTERFAILNWGWRASFWAEKPGVSPGTNNCGEIPDIGPKK